MSRQALAFRYGLGAWLLLLALVAQVAPGPANAQNAESLEREAVARITPPTPAGRGEAALAFERAADLRAARGEHYREGLNRLFAGLQHHFLGQPFRAAPLVDSAVILLSRYGSAIEAAEAETLQGELHQSRGDARAALQSYRRARERMDSARGIRLSREELDYSVGLETRIRSDMGNAFVELGEMVDSASIYLERARSERVAQGDSIGLAITLNNLARLQMTLGRSSQARELLREALDIAERHDDPLVQGWVHANIGYSYDLEGAYELAIEPQRRALSAAQRAGHQSLVGVALINLGREQLALVERAANPPPFALTAAADDLTVALTIKRSVGDSSGVAWALHDLGRVELERGRRQEGVELLQRSREMLRSSGDRVREASALLYLARAYASAGTGQDLDRAMGFFAEAHATRVLVGAQLSLDADRIAYNEQDRELTEEWTRAALLRPDPGDAARFAGLAAADLGRGRALIRLLRPSAGAAQTGDLAGSGRNLSQAVARSGARVGLYYLVASDGIIIWTVRTDGPVDITEVPIGRDSLESLVRAVRDSIAAPGGSATPPALRALSNLLLPREVRSVLPSEGELLILPQGVLNLVPFAALQGDGEVRPLGIRLALRYAPSLEALAQVESLPRTITGSGEGWSRALVVGNPTMPSMSLLGIDNYVPSQLQWADSSSRHIAALLNVERLTGNAASEAAVREKLRDPVSILHLETHGYAYQNEAEAQESFVVLAGSGGAGPRTTPTDGRLTVGEIILELPRIAAELVVLSACETALGDLRQAEGTVGLQRAFIAKGVRTVLVSLWSVSDLASATLMRSFYQEWHSGGAPSKAEALRRAQALVWDSGSTDPYYWAAFQLVGAQ